MQNLTQFSARSAVRQDDWVAEATQSAINYLSETEHNDALWDEVLADALWETTAEARAFWADRLPASAFDEGERELVASLARHNVARKVRGWTEFRLLGEGAWLTAVAWGDVVDALVAAEGEPESLYRAECAGCGTDMDVRTSPLDVDGPRCESALCMVEAGR